MADVIPELTIEGLRDIFLQVGYRAEIASDPDGNVQILRSATGGIAFEARPGNRLGGGGKSFVDFALIAGVQVEGELPLDVVNRWNTLRRFARLHLNPGLLLLAMDVSMVGGVSRDHLRANIEIWDRLLPDLVAYLREELQKQKTAAAATA
jgi:hypothetical protein